MGAGFGGLGMGMAAIPAEQAVPAWPGFHMRDPRHCHDRTTSKAGRNCADSLDPQTFKRRSADPVAHRAYLLRASLLDSVRL